MYGFCAACTSQVLPQELSRTSALLGDVVVKMATDGAQAFEAAQAALDSALPGPPLEAVLANLT